jgi:hypothetical protein
VAVARALSEFWIGAKQVRPIKLYGSEEFGLPGPLNRDPTNGRASTIRRGGLRFRLQHGDNVCSSESRTLYSIVLYFYNLLC